MTLKEQEFKYYISNNEIEILRKSLVKFMKIDNNSEKGKSFYSVKGLYFDTPYENNLNEKIDGLFLVKI